MKWVHRAAMLIGYAILTHAAIEAARIGRARLS